MRIVACPAFKNRQINPYNFLLYSQITDFGERVIEHSEKSNETEHCDVFHFHWPEAFLNKKSRFRALKSISRTFIMFFKMQRRGVKIFWTIHNLKPHEQRYPFLQRLYWRGMTKRLDGVIALSEGGLQLARQQMPAIVNIPSFVIPHGHYRDVYPRTITRSAAREKLGISQSTRVIASVGQLRPYKNIPELIRVFRDMDDQGTILLICGNPVGREIEKTIRSAAGKDPRIRLFLEWVNDVDLQAYCCSADLLVFPYRDILNSGSALLALSFDRPILVPRLGAMADLQKAVGADWVRTYEGDLSTATLGEAMDWAVNENREEHAPLDDLDWSSIARQTIAAYRTVVGDMPSQTCQP
jgi:glycosyltransferase involved in cell wall biosynthesis